MNLIPHPLIGAPFGAALDLAIILAAACWILSITSRDYSWVDRAWSIAPAIFCLQVASSVDFSSSRLNLMTFLVCLWAIRLTFNYARKGGYRPYGGEDYRWEHLRKRMGPFWFQVFNLAFIALGQLLIIWLFTSPAHHAWTALEAPLNWLDMLATVLFLTFWVGEAIADQQMWSFQQAKKARQAQGSLIDAPFLTTGLFRFSRHPNFFCELGMWWTFYLFAIAATDALLNWSVAGALALTGIFFGSTRLTEAISLSCYPSYRDYPSTTPRLIPFTRLGIVKPNA